MEVHQTRDVSLLMTRYSEIVPHTISPQPIGWFILHSKQVDHAKMILPFSDASRYRKEKVMPPRFLQIVSEQHTKSSPKCQLQT